MTLDSPDLRKMLVLLGMHLVRKYQAKVVIIDDVKRIEDANNILLVLIRVVMSVLKRIDVLTSDEVKAIAKEAKWVPDPKDLFDAKPVEDGVITGRVTVHDTLNMVDEALHQPKSRVKMPGWFVTDFWPGVLRRVARGGEMTGREKEIAMYVASTAIGER